MSDCLSQVAKGDELVIVAHGEAGYFNWRTDGGGDPTTYDGYGAGTGGGENALPLPANLTGTNHVAVTLVSCYSSLDPDESGTQVAVTQSLLDGMNAGGGNNNGVVGFVRRVDSTIDFRVKGATSIQQAEAAKQYLEAKANGSWMDNPPVNRNPVPNPNHKTAAQSLLAIAFPTKSMTVDIAYDAPALQALAFRALIAAPDSCGGAIPSGSFELVAVPGDRVGSTSARIYAAPNPFSALTVIELALAEMQGVQAGAYDVAGRQVRLLHSRQLGAGVHRFEWDGLDMNGRRCEGGIYFIRLERGGARLGTRVILLR